MTNQKTGRCSTQRPESFPLTGLESSLGADLTITEAIEQGIIPPNWVEENLALAAAAGLWNAGQPEHFERLVRSIHGEAAATALGLAIERAVEEEKPLALVAMATSNDYWENLDADASDEDLAEWQRRLPHFGPFSNKAIKRVARALGVSVDVYARANREMLEAAGRVFNGDGSLNYAASKYPEVTTVPPQDWHDYQSLSGQMSAPKGPFVTWQERLKAANNTVLDHGLWSEIYGLYNRGDIHQLSVRVANKALNFGFGESALAERDPNPGERKIISPWQHYAMNAALFSPHLDPFLLLFERIPELAQLISERLFRDHETRYVEYLAEYRNRHRGVRSRVRVARSQIVVHVRSAVNRRSAVIPESSSLPLRSSLRRVLLESPLRRSVLRAD
jgi:hypothetical protein